MHYLYYTVLSFADTSACFRNTLSSGSSELVNRKARPELEDAVRTAIWGGLGCGVANG